MRLSHTSKETFQLCPYKWHLHYQKKYRSVRVGSALAFGNSFDLALNDLLLNQNPIQAAEVFENSWGEWKNKPLIDYYKSDLDRELCSPWQLTEIDLPQNRAVSEHLLGYYTLLNKGLRMLAAYETEILPEIAEVISVQGEFTIPVPDSEHLVYGKIDLIAKLRDGHKYILDNKTTSTAYPKNSCETKPQTALYAVGLPEYEGRVGFLTINKKTFKTQILTGVAPKELQESVMQDFTEYSKQINLGEFGKNKKGCMAFGQKCIYYSHCWGNGFSEDIYEEVKGEL